MKHRATIPIVLFALAAAAAGPRAHEVPVERIVEMFVLPAGDHLDVLVRLPVSVLADAGLPRLPDGALDLPRLERPLRLVAGDLANNLEIRQDEIALAQPTAAMMVSSASDPSFASPAAARAHIHGDPLPAGSQIHAQQAVVDLELRFPAGADRQQFSARLNAFHAPGPDVRTVAHYVLPSGQVRTFSVAGPPERVSFDPDLVAVAQQFVQRALSALLDGGDQLLFLVCLLIPVRGARSLARVVAAMACGQVVSMAAAAFHAPMSGESVLLVGMVAASALVMAALQNIVAARERWLWPLAFGFGALNGAAFGNTLSLAVPFAGAHTAVAALVFALVVEAGQAWIAALLWATRTWLDERGLPRMPATVVLSLWIAHSAVHRIVDRGVVLEQAGVASLDRAIVLIALAWAAVMVAAAAVEALGGPSRRAGPTSAAEALLS